MQARCESDVKLNALEASKVAAKVAQASEVSKEAGREAEASKEDAKVEVNKPDILVLASSRRFLPLMVELSSQCALLKVYQPACHLSGIKAEGTESFNGQHSRLVTKMTEVLFLLIKILFAEASFSHLFGESILRKGKNLTSCAAVVFKSLKEA